MVYYVIALALYMQSSYREVLRCLLEGVQWLAGPSHALEVAGKSGISQARTRLGWEPLHRLHGAVVKPGSGDQGGVVSWRLVSLDGSTLDVADEASTAAAFGRPGASRPQRLPAVALRLAGGERYACAVCQPGYGTSEITLAKAVLGRLEAGMLCLADRQFFGFALWSLARGSGADLLWGVRKNMRLVPDRRLPDGSYLSTIYPSERDRRHRTGGLTVRAIDYRLEGVGGAEPFYRLLTTSSTTTWRRRMTGGMSAGKSRPHSTNSRPICGAPGSSCAGRRTSSARSSMAS